MGGETVRALKGVDLTIGRNELVAVMGPSGSGKSTLMNILGCLDVPTAGRYWLDGDDVAGMAQSELARVRGRRIGFVFQTFELLPRQTALRNVELPLTYTGAPDRRARATEALARVGLADRMGHRPSQMSGGQRQRVAIARALALKPKLFLLDEPMSALDAKLREALQIELKLLQERLGITTILVTHDQREALTMADLVVVMSEGRIQQIAPPMEVYSKPATAFVADFIGTTNLLKGQVKPGGLVQVADIVLTLPDLPASGAVTLSIRPEDLRLVVEPGPNRLPGTITFVRHLGATVEVSVDVGPAVLVVLAAARERAALASGQAVHVAVDPATCVVLP